MSRHPTQPLEVDEREALADLLYDTLPVSAEHIDGGVYVDGYADLRRVADAVLSRWRLRAMYPVTEGFDTEDERFNVAAKLGWLEGELSRANWVHHRELSSLTSILLQRIEDLEEYLKRA